MAFTDNAISFSYTDLDNAIGRAEKMHPTKAQYTMLGRTTRHMRFKKMPIKGKKHYYRMLVQPESGVRRDGYTSAVETEFPVARQAGYDEFSLSHSQLAMFRKTSKWNTQREIKEDDVELSVAKLAVKIMMFTAQDFAAQVNAAMYQSRTCAITTVVSIHDLDASGTAYSSGTGYASKYIRVAGNIGSFQRGQVLEIYDVADGTTKNVTVVVQEVIHGDDGPWVGGSRPAGIGAGIICQPCDSTGAVDTGTTWGATAVPAVGDYLALSGEFSTTAYNSFPGIPDFFDTTQDCHYDADGNAVDREAVGNQYLNPMVIIPSGASAGSEVAFSIEDHFAQLEDTLPYFIDFGRDQRNIGDGLSGPEQQIMPTAMTFHAQPEIVNYVNRTYAGDTVRFTSTAASSLSDAKKKELFGVVGFEGMIYHSASLPPIGFLGDPNCKPKSGYLLEPSSWQLLTYGTSPGDGDAVNIDYVKHGSSGRVHPVYGDTNGTPTFYVQTAAFTTCGLTNDQPKANVEFRHIKSDRQ